MNTCTECGEEIVKSQTYLAGVQNMEAPEGELEFFWACEHQPVQDAFVRLGSQGCVEQFCLRNPEHFATILALISQREQVH